MRMTQHWAYLNEEGMKTWGHIYPDKTVPVLSMIPQYGPLGPPDSPPQHYFLVYLAELTEKQLEATLDILTERFQAPREVMRKEFMEHGLPLRQSLTNGSGTNNPGMFL